MGGFLTRALLTAGAAGLVVAGAAGCKGAVHVTAGHPSSAGAGNEGSASAPAPGGTATAEPVPAGGSTAPAAGTPSTGGAPGGPAGPGGVAACKNAWLKVTEDPTGSDGAAGTIVERYVIHNQGSTSCDLYGHPGVAPYGDQIQSNGAPAVLKPMQVGRIEPGFASYGGPATHVVVRPGGTAVFYVRSSDVPVGSGTCPQAYGMVFAAPPAVASSFDTARLVRFEQPKPLCGAAISVSAVFAS